MAGAEVKQGMPQAVLTAAPHGVGIGQLGEPWLAEVAAVPLHILLADTAPRQWVTDGAGHGAIWVTLAGWKRARNSTVKGCKGWRGSGEGAAAGNWALTLTGFRMGEILPLVTKIVGFAAFTVVAFGIVLAVVTDAPAHPSAHAEQLQVKAARGRVTVAIAP